MGYVLDGGEMRVRFPAGARHFSPLHSIQTGSEAHPASSPSGAEGSFPGGKADHSPPFTAEVKNEWRYTFPSPCVFIA
jgi:hypothetical protein